MIRLTIGTTGCLAEVKKSPFSDYSPPVEIDLNKFLYSFQTEQNFTSDIPIGYFKHTEINDQIYLWQVFHNTNNIFTFNYMDGDPLNLYIPYIIFKWRLKIINDNYKITGSWIAIGYDSPFNVDFSDVYHFHFTNVYNNDKICWGSHRVEGSNLPGPRQLGINTNIFLYEARNNDIVSRYNLEDDHELPNNNGIFGTILLEEWETRNFVGNKLDDFWLARG